MLERRPGPTTRVRVVEWRAAASAGREDRVATEEPLEIRAAWPGSPAQRFGVTMRTPGHDFALAVGLGRAEGVFTDVEAVRQVAYCTDRTLLPDQAYNVVTLELREPPVRWRSRSQPVSSACGVCGTQSLDEVADVGARPLRVMRHVPAQLIGSLPDRLRAHQRGFDRTGGLHAAGSFGPDGDALVVREDIGRHNAVDKVVGQALLDRQPLREAVLCVSGRVGFEIVQKAAVAEVPLVVAVGAPSSLAVDLARRYGITIAGFVRGDRMVVYSHPERIV